jgi:CTP:molybdopterin cytidylyltransferase MocA
MTAPTLATGAFPIACVVISLDALAVRASDQGGDSPCWAGEVERAEQLRRVVEVASHAGAAPIVAVLPSGIEVPAAARAIASDRGGSDLALRLGLAQLANTSVTGTLVWPLEAADVGLETALAVLDAAKRTGAPIVAPHSRGADGWPLYFARDAWRELMTTPGGARVVLRQGSSVHRVTIDSGVELSDFAGRED